MGTSKGSNASAPTQYTGLNVNSSAYGIETMLMGRWAGGADDPGVGATFDDDNRPRVDWEFYSSTNFPPATVYKIKGMAGCRSLQMCSGSNTTAITDAIGKFRLTSDDVARYGLTDIACGLKPQTSSCE